MFLEIFSISENENFEKQNPCILVGTTKALKIKISISSKNIMNKLFYKHFRIIVQSFL